MSQNRWWMEETGLQKQYSTEKTTRELISLIDHHANIPSVNESWVTTHSAWARLQGLYCELLQHLLLSKQRLIPNINRRHGEPVRRLCSDLLLDNQAVIEQHACLTKQCSNGPCMLPMSHEWFFYTSNNQPVIYQAWMFYYWLFFCLFYLQIKQIITIMCDKSSTDHFSNDKNTPLNTVWTSTKSIITYCCLFTWFITYHSLVICVGVNLRVW